MFAGLKICVLSYKNFFSGRFLFVTKAKYSPQGALLYRSRTTLATVCHIVCFFFQLFSYTRSATTCSQRDKEMPSLPGS